MKFNELPKVEQEREKQLFKDICIYQYIEDQEDDKWNDAEEPSNEEIENIMEEMYEYDDNTREQLDNCDKVLDIDLDEEENKIVMSWRYRDDY